MALPNSLPWIESVDAKIDRAGVHLDAVQTEICVFLKETKREGVVKVDSDRAFLVWWVKDPFPPIRVSTLIGDCVFNMRCALDHLVCALVRKRRPDASCSGTQFPIYLDPEKCVANWKSNLRAVQKEARTLIRQLQPCYREYGTPETHPLAILNYLSNLDKHRAVFVTTRADMNVGFRIHALDGTIETILLNTVWGENPITVPLNTHPRFIGPKVRVESFGTGHVTFREAGPWGERPVTEVLISLFQFVKERVIPRFKPFFT